MVLIGRTQVLHGDQITETPFVRVGAQIPALAIENWSGLAESDFL
jgi:hypothetical protein